ncbi:PAS domain-containing protein [Methanospirillum stamsii]|nr:PAS domain-containing protein [Methanospirillum stamsii]
MVKILLVHNGGVASSCLKKYLSGLLQVDLTEVRTIQDGVKRSQIFLPEIICIPLSADTDSDIHEIMELQHQCHINGFYPGFLLYTLHENHLFFLDITHESISIPINLVNTGHQLLSSLRQISGRSKVERSLRDDYERQNQIVTKMPLSCLQVEDGIISRSNPFFSTLTGIDPSDIIRTPVQSLVSLDPSHEEELTKNLHQVMCIEAAIRDKNADLLPCRITIDPVDSDKPGDGIWFIEDRREYAAINAVLRETEYECKEQLYLSETLVMKLQPDGTISFANPATIRCFGYDPDTLAGLNVNILFPPGSIQDVTNPSELFLEVSDESSSAIHIFEHCKKSGERLWIAWTSRGLYTRESELSGIICIGTDMTEQASTGEERMSTRVWRDRILQSTDISPEIFDAILQACIEIGREGREGKAIGTSFLVGDADEVLKRSRQLILNPFSGHPPEMRTVSLPDVREMLKEYALLDGAFVVTGDGILESAGRYITLDTSSISLPKGMGTRHSSVAALTGVTKSIGFVVSESGGKVSIMKQGKIVKVIA